MTQTPQPVAFSGCGSAASSFQRSVTSSLTVEEVVTRLKQGIIAADLWILHEIDPQMLLSRGGFAHRPRASGPVFPPTPDVAAADRR
ncbi:hypothetical protein ACVWZV_002308 [Bradyrhizobium sp. GM5.1]